MYSIADHFYNKYMKKNTIKQNKDNMQNTSYINIENVKYSSSSLERFLSCYLSKDELILRDNLITILNNNYQQQQLNQSYEHVSFIGKDKYVFNMSQLNISNNNMNIHSYNLYSYFLEILDILKSAFMNKSSWRGLLYKYLKQQNTRIIIGISAMRNFILQNKLVLSFTTILHEHKFVTTFDQYICCIKNNKLPISSTRYPRIYYYHSEVRNNHVLHTNTNEY